jgi:phosphoglycolate phosphatase-like HAD superfamily hydrolase
MNICFDFDGPIIDVSERYYQAYIESLKGIEKSKLNILEKSVFWELKKNRISDFEIGLMTGLTLNESVETAELRRSLNFKTNLFIHDKLFSDVSEVFTELTKRNIFFFIVTLRRNSHLNYAIKQFKLNKLIVPEKAFSVEDKKDFTNDIQEKYVLLVNAFNKLGIDQKETWMVGDSETDIHAGRLAKYSKVIGIARGIRSREQLETLKPDNIINSLTEIIGLLNS